MCSLLYKDGGKREEEKQMKERKKQRKNEGKVVYNRSSKTI
jgi:hypothetical protein